MIRPSKKLLAAIEAVLEIAFSAGGQPMRGSELTRRQGMPARFLEPVLQELVRSGVLTSVRGPRGGYKLARERRRISLGDIYRAAGATTPAEDPDDDIPPSPITAKVVQPLWDKLAAELQQQLDAVTLDDLCREARAKGIGNLGGDCLDFTI